LGQFGRQIGGEAFLGGRKTLRHGLRLLNRGRGKDLGKKTIEAAYRKGRRKGEAAIGVDHLGKRKDRPFSYSMRQVVILKEGLLSDSVRTDFKHYYEGTVLGGKGGLFFRE